MAGDRSAPAGSRVRTTAGGTPISQVGIPVTRLAWSNPCPLGVPRLTSDSTVVLTPSATATASRGAASCRDPHPSGTTPKPPGHYCQQARSLPGHPTPSARARPIDSLCGTLPTMPNVTQAAARARTDCGSPKGFSPTCIAQRACGAAPLAVSYARGRSARSRRVSVRSGLPPRVRVSVAASCLSGAVGSAAKRYPTCGTVAMSRGGAGSPRSAGAADGCKRPECSGGRQSRGPTRWRRCRRAHHAVRVRDQQLQERKRAPRELDLPTRGRRRWCRDVDPYVARGQSLSRWGGAGPSACAAAPREAARSALQDSPAP